METGNTSVALVEHIAEHVPRGQRRGILDGRRGDQQALQLREVPPTRAVVLDDGVDHGRHHETVGNAFAFHEVECLPGVEVVQHDVAAAAEPGGQVLIAGAVGNGAEVHALVAGFDRRKRIEPVAPGVEPGLVGIGNALGLAGGAAGVANDEIVVFGDVEIRVVARVLRQPVFIACIAHPHLFEIGQVIGNAGDLRGVVLAHHQQPAPGVAEHVQMRLAPVARIQRHAHQVGGRGTAEEVRRLDRVVFEYADPVSRLEARGQHGIGQAQGALPGLSEGEAAVAVHHRF